MNELEMTEFIKCQNSVEYFIETYVKTIHVDKGLINVKLNKFQKEAIKDFQEKSFFCKITGRQEGKTFLAQCLFLHIILFQPYKVCTWISHKQMAGSYSLKTIVELYERLPDFLKINNKLLKSTKTKLEFENGASIMVFSSSSDGMRGRAISYIYIDESEFVPDLRELIAKFLPNVVSKTGKLFAFTSARTNDIFSYNKMVHNL